MRKAGTHPSYGSRPANRLPPLRMPDDRIEWSVLWDSLFAERYDDGASRCVAGAAELF